MRKKMRYIVLDTHEVQTILDGKRTVLRRAQDSSRMLSSFKVGEILWVKETWAPMYKDEESSDIVGCMYRADDGRMTVDDFDDLYPEGSSWTWTGRWRSPTQMPREFVRILLKVKSITVQRLQEITVEDVKKEGQSSIEEFVEHWDDRMKNSNRLNYCWLYNPDVLVIEFQPVVDTRWLTANKTDADLELIELLETIQASYKYILSNKNL